MNYEFDTNEEVFEEFSGFEKDRSRQTRRENDLRVGKKCKQILKLGHAGEEVFEKSDLYYKDGHCWANGEREFCGKVTKSKLNGFNPKFSEKKKYDKLNYQEDENEEG